MALLIPEVCCREKPVRAYLLLDAEVVLHDVGWLYVLGIAKHQGALNVRGVLGARANKLREGVCTIVQDTLLVCEGEMIR